jgi:hypothetical protein
MSALGFKQTIIDILSQEFGGERSAQVFQESPLLQYIEIKTRSANRGSKARGSFANLYAIYVLVEDYIRSDSVSPGGYADYKGARYTDLFQRQRELPFGERLQNHALNNRLNEEFRKYFPTSKYTPILRNHETNRYWINEGLLRVALPAAAAEINISASAIAIIDAYVAARRDSFQRFLDSCRRLAEIEDEEAIEGIAFVESLLAPTVDARIFEIVSFAILRSHYAAQSIWIGSTRDEVKEQPLVLYKTGRTNANDGGIDYVMRPLGRFYQVTETLDVRKYFLDIDKVQRFPITFVVKSELTTSDLTASIRQYAEKAFTAHAVVETYMNAVEEIINITTMKEHLKDVVARGEFGAVLGEIVTQAKVEFYLYEDEPGVTESDDA